MTLIAFAAHDDHAEILTDTATYTHVDVRMGATSKTALLPHLDAAILVQGSTSFQVWWQTRALALCASGVDDFDDLNLFAVEELRALYAQLQEQLDAENQVNGTSGDLAKSIAFHVGWSPRAGKFRALYFASDFNFEPRKMHGLHVMPSPLDARPSDVEQQRLEAHLQACFGDNRPARVLRRLRAPAVPRTVEEWIDLGLRVRRDRALAHLHSGFKTYVAGSLIHTRLEVGAATQRRVHTFDDTGEEFAEIVRYSLHPLGQAGPCFCGSGGRLIDCCLAELSPKPCPCGSGTVFEECCRVREEPAEAPVTAAELVSQR